MGPGNCKSVQGRRKDGARSHSGRPLFAIERLGVYTRFAIMALPAKTTARSKKKKKYM